MTRRRILAGVVFAVCASACSTECGSSSGPAPQQVIVPIRGADRSQAHAPAPLTTVAAAPSSTARAKPANDATLHAELAAYEAAAPETAKSVGHTSVVLKLKLSGGLTAAYKPKTARGPLRYKGEIAAYRLATALGLDNVPPALPRTFSLSSLITAAGGAGSDGGALLVKEAIADPAGDVPGALMPWIPKLSFLAIDAEPLLSEWKGWLNGKADVPADKVRLAGEISTLIVFDYVTANWDRWSGGNVGFDPERGALLFIDNDAAFYDNPPAGLVAVQRARLDAITRFSRSFVDQLRRLDDKGLAAAIGEEGGAPLLGEKALAGVLTRREAALKQIDARVAKAGEAATLVFE